MDNELHILDLDDYALSAASYELPDVLNDVLNNYDMEQFNGYCGEELQEQQQFQQQQQQFQQQHQPEEQHLNEIVLFDFVEQPKQYHRFRYISDIEKSSHGVLLSANSTTYVKKFPTVQLLAPNYPTNSEFHILCVLCEESLNNPNDLIRLSPHILVQKVKSEKGKSKKYNISYKPINGIMKCSAGNKYEYTFSLEDYFILRTVIEKRNEAVYEKYKELKAAGWPIDNIIKYEGLQLANEQGNKKKRKTQNNPNRIESVCLCFIVFQKINNQYHYFAGPILSNQIINGETIRIHKICNPIGSIKGGDEVTLLVLNAKNNDFIVQIYEINQNDQTVWSKEIDCKMAEFFTCAISFKTPKYDREIYDETRSEIQCYIKVKRKSDQSFSDPVKFIYKNIQKSLEFEPERKKPRQSTLKNDSTLLPALSISQREQQQLFFKDSINIQNQQLQKEVNAAKMTIESAIDKLKKIANNKKIEREELLKQINDLNEAYMLESPTGNSIYYDAIKHESGHHFLRIYTVFRTLNYSAPLQKAVSASGDTLLHLTCLINKPDYIRPLIGNNCKITAQNLEDDTPLHIAIEQHNFDCIEKFRDIMNKTDYEHIEEEFMQLMQLYNRQGYTILHLAVLHDLRDFVFDILQFCKRNTVAGYAVEVLGSGNSILHLAVINNLREMVELITKEIPAAIHYENYARFTAFNMKNFIDLDSDVLELIEGIQNQCHISLNGDDDEKMS